MLFSEKKVFIYDQRRKAKFFFKDVVQAYQNPEKVSSDFALSGLDDLANSLWIIEEYYNRNFAHVEFKELRRDSVKVDALYHEPANLRREFSRVIDIPVYINQEDKTTKLSKQGAQTNHTVDFCTGMINLFRMDYFPEIGDEIVWMGTVYFIGEVVYKRDHLHQNTGFPLHVTMKTSISQWGDEKFPDKLVSKNSISGTPEERIGPRALGHRIPVIRLDT
jgi:hypothetical protein